MPPNEIVPRRGPPSVEYLESDKKVNREIRRGPRISLCVDDLRRGLPITLYVDDFKAWTPYYTIC